MNAEPEVFSELKTVGAAIIRRGNYVNWFLASLLTTLLVWGLIDYFMDRNLPRIWRVEIQEATLPLVEVCPGDKMNVRFNLTVEGQGLMMRDTSVQQGSRTLIYSEDPLRYPVIGPINDLTSFSWEVPASYFDYVTGQDVPLPPDEYIFIVAISSRSRDELSDQVSVPFRIKEDCSGQLD